jgi:hypothetical protein
VEGSTAVLGKGKKTIRVKGKESVKLQKGGEANKNGSKNRGKM